MTSVPAIERVEITHAGRRVVLLGTRVVGRDTLDDIARLIHEERPSAVAIDYDETRWEWLTDRAKRDGTDLVQVIRAGDLAVLNARLALGVARKLTAPRASDVGLDEEYIIASEAARRAAAELVFLRRPVDTEGLRAWRAHGLGGRIALFVKLAVGSLKGAKVAADELEQHRSSWATDVLDRLRVRAPKAIRVVYDEAATVSASRLTARPGDLVVVTEAVSIPLLKAALEEHPSDVAALETVRSKSLFSRAVPWLFSAAIIAAFVLGFVFGDTEKMEQAATAWFLVNMTMSAIGAILALAHPITVIATSVSSPFVSLNPAVGAGMVGAFVQAFVAPPSVRDMESVGDDISSWRGWWSNRLARIILIFIFANVGSTIGSFLALAWLPNPITE